MAAADIPVGTSTDELISGMNECHAKHGDFMSREGAFDSARFVIKELRRAVTAATGDLIPMRADGESEHAV